MRILFMGTPDFAVPSLEALVAAGHTVCGVFTQPDKPRNRGMKLQAPPVKVCALAHNMPVFQPVKLRDGAALALIQELAPELIVVAAYGRILPDEILAAPPKGCINVHSSLLPNYRGAAPIHWAVLNGDRGTGVTIGAGSGAAGERGGGHRRRNGHTHPPGARQGHPGPHAEPGALPHGLEPPGAGAA